jgi:lipid A 3-O-deacylase
MKTKDKTLRKTGLNTLPVNGGCWIAAFTRQIKILLAASCACLVLLAFCGFAAEPSTNSIPAVSLDAKPDLQQSSSIWRDGIGTGLQKGAEEVSVSFGDGIGMKAFGSKQSHDMLLGRVGYGRILTDVLAGNSWLRGNLEGEVEGLGGGQYYPRGAYLFGLTPLLRYNIATGNRWMPFVDAGAGVSLTDIGRPDLSTVFEFNLQAGAGCDYFLKQNLALTLQYRYIHLSNARIATPNCGVNTGILYLGLTRFF